MEDTSLIALQCCTYGAYFGSKLHHSMDLPNIRPVADIRWSDSTATDTDATEAMPLPSLPKL